MSVMSALVFSVLIGVAAAWTKAAVITKFLEEFQIVLAIVTNIVIPLLPILSPALFARCRTKVRLPNSCLCS